MRPIWKKILVISIVLNVVFASLATWGYIESNKLNITWKSDDYYAERVHQFEHMTLDAGDVVFVGDSITELGNWGEWFCSPHVQNLGIGGDTTQGVLNRLAMITQAKPGKIFLMIGINDLIQRGARSIPAIRDDYRQILERVVEESPETQVYVQSVLPVNTMMIGLNFTNNDIEALNVGLLEMSSEMGVGYVDLYSRFIKDRQCDETYTWDGIHLTEQGYSLWRDAIRDLVGLTCPQ